MQNSIPFRPAACPRCPYHRRNLCRGPEGILPWVQAKDRVGCHDIELQQKAYRELHDGWKSVDCNPLLHVGLTLPRFIPVMSARTKWRPRFSGNIVFGVSLKSLLEKDGRLSYTSPVRLRRALRLGPDARLALIANASDERLEELWSRSAELRAWEKLAGLRFEFATSCTYSVWNNDERFDQIYNQERNWRIYEVLSSLGMPTIPFVFCLRHVQQLELAPWFEAHPEVRVVAVLAQRLRTNTQFEEFFADMVFIAEIAKRPLHFLVVGVAEANRLRRIASRFSASFVTDQPIQCALHGRLIGRDLKPSKASKKVGRSSLARTNVQRYTKFVDALPVPP